MKLTKDQKNKIAIKAISTDRERTNLLRGPEQKAIAFLVQRIPAWISSDMLTFIGLLGTAIVLVAYVLASYLEPTYLLIGVFGYFIHWLGDSLDGRIAYYRNKPRKWYGFSLDITTDWLGIILMGIGFVVYVSRPWEILGFFFVVLYGWEMLTSLLRYKITGKYSIDSGLLSPTEVRIILSLILILEVIIHGSIIYVGTLANVILLVTNIVDTKKLLKLADERDIAEKAEKARENGANETASKEACLKEF